MKSQIKNESLQSVNLLIVLCAIFIIGSVTFVVIEYYASIIMILLIICICIFIDLEQMFFVLSFCLPIADILKLSLNSITVLPFIYLIFFVKLFFRNTHFGESKLIAFLVLTFIAILNALLRNAGLNYSVSFLFNIFFAIFVGQYFYKNATKNFFNNVAIYFSLALALSIILVLIFPEIRNKVGHVDFGNRLNALCGDPNSLTQDILIACGLLLFVLFSLPKKSKLICLILLVFLLISGFFTYSKSYALTLILMVGWAFIDVCVKLRKKNSKYFYVFLIFILCIAITSLIFVYLFVIRPIFDERSGSDFFTGRLEIWSGYLKLIFSDVYVFIFGCGIRNAINYVNEFDVIAVAHNTYLELISENGFLGVIVIIYLMWIPLYNALRARNLFNFYSLAMISFLITSFGISINAADTIYWIFVLYHVNINTSITFRKGDYLKNEISLYNKKYISV